MDCGFARRHHRVLVGIMLSMLLVVGLAGPVPSVAAQQGATNATDSDGSEFPPHQNPAEISAEGDLQQLEGLLSGSLGGQLTGSIESLDQDDYEQARALLGDSYDRNLSRYREIAVELDTGERAELFATVRSNQQEYVDAVERYETTLAEYEEARREGDDERARELVRDLTAAADEVNGNGRRLVEVYQRIGNETGQEYTDQISNINTQRTKATETKETAAAELTETTLSATASQSSVSFTDDLRITGELRTADSRPVASQQVQIAIQDQQYTVDLASDGKFELTAQPDDIWQTADQLQIRYVPNRSAEYLSAATTLAVNVEPTPTTVSVESVNDPLRYDKSLDIRGTVTTTETSEAVPSVPIVLRIGGTRIETIETTDTGQFSFSGALPSTVSAGDSAASVTLQPGSLAVDAAGSQTSVTVEPTDTVVSVNATLVQETPEESPIQVRGRVESIGGRPVEEATVTVQIDQTTVGEVETHSNGEFIDQFTVPAKTDRSEPIVVAAEFDRPGSSLLSDSDSTTVVPPETVLQTGDRLYGSLGIGLSLIGGLGLLAAAGWVVRNRSTRPQPTTVEPTAEAEIGMVQNQELLTAAADHLEDGAAKTAALLAYVTVRRQLAAQVAVSETATHWEWYQACVAAGVDQLSELETLVEAFEQVTFAPDGDDSTAAASRAVSTARQLLDSED